MHAPHVRPEERHLAPWNWSFRQLGAIWGLGIEGQTREVRPSLDSVGEEVQSSPGLDATRPI